MIVWLSALYWSGAQKELQIMVRTINDLLNGIGQPVAYLRSGGVVFIDNDMPVVDHKAGADNQHGMGSGPAVWVAQPLGDRFYQTSFGKIASQFGGGVIADSERDHGRNGDGRFGIQYRINQPPAIPLFTPG